MQRIRHCPFCGITPDVKEIISEDTKKKQGFVGCVEKSCPAKPSVTTRTLNEAIRLWNRRRAFPVRK